MQISDIKVCQSAAGYYVGREYFDEDGHFWGPWSRESLYFATREDAETERKRFESGDNSGRRIDP